MLGACELREKTMVRSLEQALTIRLGETLRHPVFGRIKVAGIYELPDLKYEAFCVLEDFNNTHRLFDLQNLADVKFRVVTLRVVK